MAKTPYFNVKHLGEPTFEYVGWVDVMGIQSHMARSIYSTAIFVYKLHVAALNSKNDALSLYPVMDGFYVSSPTKKALEEFLKKVLGSLAQTFLEEKKQHFRFVVKGGIAYGQVYHGKNVSEEASDILGSNKDYRDNILLGLPMVQANIVEKHSPPFGISIHESARQFSPKGEPSYHEFWWRWYENEKGFDVKKMGKELDSFYSWCNDHSEELIYAKDRINIHRQLGKEYFSALRVDS
jgi:hypothetical protein